MRHELRRTIAYVSKGLDNETTYGEFKRNRVFWFKFPRCFQIYVVSLRLAPFAPSAKTPSIPSSKEGSGTSVGVGGAP